MSNACELDECFGQWIVHCSHLIELQLGKGKWRIFMREKAIGKTATTIFKTCKWFNKRVNCTVSRMPHERMARQVLLATPTGKRPRGCPRTKWSDSISDLAWVLPCCGTSRSIWHCCWPWRISRSPRAGAPHPPQRKSGHKNKWIEIIEKQQQSVSKKRARGNKRLKHV